MERMTQSQIWETFSIIDSVRKVVHIANLDQGTVKIEIRDPKHGHAVIRTLKAVPTIDQIRQILSEMDAEMKQRNRKANRGLAAEKEIDRE